MVIDKAGTYAKKCYPMILFPLNGESIRKCVWGNNLLVRSDQICGDTKTRCLSYFRPEEHKYGVPKFLLHMLKNNCTDARLSQVVNLSIFYNI